MTYPIDNQYRYGVVYNLDGQIVGFNVSPDVFVGLTDDDIEKALETYAKRKLEQCSTEDKMKVLEKIRAEIKEWYWHSDKQELQKDPCVVDAMVDLFIRTIDKYMKEGE